MIGDIGLAEEFAQDAVVAALEQWPRSGVPPNPGAWLTLTAKRRAFDRARRVERLQHKTAQLAELEQQRRADAPDPVPDDVTDDVLRLIFIACHPVLSVEARVALTLKTVAGLTVDQIAAGFLTSSATIAQRIVRAKRTLASRGIRFELPEAAESVPTVLGARSDLPDLQRGLFSVVGRGPHAARAVPRSRASGTRPRGDRGRRGRGAWSGRPVGTATLPGGGPRRWQRRPDPAPGAEPRTLGPAADPPRLHRAAACRTVPRAARPLRPAGRDRCVPRAGPHCC